MFKRGWKEGNATVVARKTHEGGYRKGVNFYAPTGLYHHVYDYIADVQPDDGGPVYRATFVELFQSDAERRPIAGEEARVRFDPKSHEVEFDRKALQLDASAEAKGEQDQFAALANAEPGTVTAPEPSAILPSATVAAVPGISDDSREALLDVSLRLAVRRGDTAEVSRLSQELADLRAGR